MSRAIVWFRQDLRIQDNPALACACLNHDQILCLYILEDKAAVPIGGAQQWWLHRSLSALKKALQQEGIDLTLKSGDADTVLTQLIKTHQIDSVYWNRLYEPAHVQRDKRIKYRLAEHGIHAYTSNGSLLNEPWMIKNQAGSYFKVFTPFWRQCLRQMNIPVEASIEQWPQALRCDSDRLEDWHLCPTKPNWAINFSDYWQPGSDGAWQNLELFLNKHLNHYPEARDMPSRMATSRLSPHMHFGEISPMQIWRTMRDITNDPDISQSAVNLFLAEVGWREFSYHLLFNFPELLTNNFRPEFDLFPWSEDENLLQRWQRGLTGYPIVDAGMRELWQTGYMHNRVRMVVASFLTKDLLIDWRKGAAWFDKTLLDADQANNYASWQWVAGCGADAAPYFRIFNPILQGEKFDPGGAYVRQFVPELSGIPNKWIHKPWLAPPNELPIQLGNEYPLPIVDHGESRHTALQYYKQLKTK